MALKYDCHKYFAKLSKLIDIKYDKLKNMDFDLLSSDFLENKVIFL